MQGKLQSTLASAKSPTLNLQPPQINKVDLTKIQVGTEQLANQTKDWGVSAFKSLSSAAQRVSANVSQGIQKEHEEFLKQKKLDTVTPHQGTGNRPSHFIFFPPSPLTFLLFLFLCSLLLMKKRESRFLSSVVAVFGWRLRVESYAQFSFLLFSYFDRSSYGYRGRASLGRIAR